MLKVTIMRSGYSSRILEMSKCPLAQLFPAPVWPNTKLSGLKIWPYGPERTLSMVPGSRSMSTARGLFLLSWQQEPSFATNAMAVNCERLEFCSFEERLLKGNPENKGQTNVRLFR